MASRIGIIPHPLTQTSRNFVIGKFSAQSNQKNVQKQYILINTNYPSVLPFYFHSYSYISFSFINITFAAN